MIKPIPELDNTPLRAYMNTQGELGVIQIVYIRDHHSYTWLTFNDVRVLMSRPRRQIAPFGHRLILGAIPYQITLACIYACVEQKMERKDSCLYMFWLL